MVTLLPIIISDILLSSEQHEVTNPFQGDVRARPAEPSGRPDGVGAGGAHLRLGGAQLHLGGAPARRELRRLERRRQLLREDQVRHRRRRGGFGL